MNGLTPPPARGIPTAGADGWTVEHQGRYPGVRRMLACWAGAPVTAVAVVHAATAAGTGMVAALYAAAATGTALIGLGAAVTVRATARADARAAAARPARPGADGVQTDQQADQQTGQAPFPVLPATVAQDVPARSAAPQRHQIPTRRPA